MIGSSWVTPLGFIITSTTSNNALFSIKFQVPSYCLLAEFGFTLIIISSPFDSVITFYPMEATNSLSFTQNVSTSNHSIYSYLTGFNFLSNYSYYSFPIAAYYDLIVSPNNLTLTLFSTSNTILTYLSLYVLVIDTSPAIPVPVLINYYQSSTYYDVQSIIRTAV